MAALASSGTAFAAAPSSVVSSLKQQDQSADQELSSPPPTTTSSGLQLDTVSSALEAIAAGEFVVVVDDLDRENEGDLICAASLTTTKMMSFLIRHSSGFVCVCLEKGRLEELELKMMVEDNKDRNGTAYAITCDYVHGQSLYILLTAFN